MLSQVHPRDQRQCLPRSTIKAQLVHARLDSGVPPTPGVGVIQRRLQECMRLSLDANGRVQGVASLTPSAGVGAPLGDAVRTWSLRPAREAGEPVPAEVLVAGVFRPATLHDPLGLDGLLPAGLPGPSKVMSPIPSWSHPLLAEASQCSRGRSGPALRSTSSAGHDLDSRQVVTATPGFAASALDTARRCADTAVRRHQPRATSADQPGGDYQSCSAFVRRSSVGGRSVDATGPPTGRHRPTSCTTAIVTDHSACRGSCPAR